MTSILSALTGWVLFSGLVASIGSVVTTVVVLPRAAGPGAIEPTWTRSTHTLGVVGAALTLLGLLMVGARQLAEFRDPFVPWTEDAALLLSLEWGSYWKAAVTGAVALVLFAALLRAGQRLAFVPFALLAAALAFFPGLTGHANGVEDLRAVALAMDGLHVWGAGAWIGCLAAVLLIERSVRRTDSSATALPALVPAFSPVAVVGVATLIVTGVFATWLHIPDRNTLTGTTYGGTLLLKLALVIVAITLGAQNARFLTPQLNTDEGVTELRRTAAFELAIAQLILIITAILVRTSPLGH